MISYSKQKLSTQAKELGFIRDTLEKVLRLTEILNYINNTPILKENLALKGGTAINLTIFRLPRLSVDIDLDFTNNVSKDQMIEMRSRISDTIVKYMIANGYQQSSKSKTPHSLDSYVFDYINSAGVKDNVKIEINYSLRAHLLLCRSSESKMPELLGNISIRTLDPIEIYASKILALLTRSAPRDLYDINNMIISELFSNDELLLLKKCIVFYAAIAIEKPPLNFNFERITNIQKYEIFTQLNPVISRNDKFELLEAKNRVIGFLAELLILNENEKQFLISFSKNQYQPELLFDNAEIFNRIKDHPMAFWKTRTR